MRSKSEVIIANLLHAKGINYHYEEPLEFDGITNYPDFTIEDGSTGKTYYWEHLGMLNDPRPAAVEGEAHVVRSKESPRKKRVAD